MKLSTLGYNPIFQQYREEQSLTDFGIARVIRENKERYIVVSENGEFEAQVVGNLIYTATSRFDFPAVGDWVAISELDQNQAIIHAVIKRQSYLARKAIESNDIQLIAANINTTFITTAADRDFNLNRIERYLAIINSGNVKPEILLTKTDLNNKEELSNKIDLLNARFEGITIHCISNLSDPDIKKFASTLEQNKTYCFVGSSGVGKSTLINNLAQKEILQTKEISNSTNKGKHATTHRELFVLNTGYILIDTPGMREIGVTSEKSGIEGTFSNISDLAKSCKFQNCTHNNEPGCAIIEALENNELDVKLFENYQKLEKERSYLEATKEEKRQKDKNFGKMVKQVMKQKKKSKHYLS
ncbi:MAG: ribosome small subunit-dependent GTPase A [Salinivirgaceae bacterium]|jgi:ribosome biogenesis GTPase|nr:ribosome small subunit-dependent GTPase A [Salinivirgaceae bacterium]